MARYPIEQDTAIMDAIEELLVGAAEISPAAETPAKPGVTGFWEKTWDYLVNGASITVGTGLRQAEMTVTRKIDGATGKIAQRNEQAYFLSYSTRTSFIIRSSFVGCRLEQDETVLAGVADP